MSEEIISLEEVLMLAASHNRQKTTITIKDNSIQTKINYKTPFKIGNEAYSNLTIDSYYTEPLEKMSGRTIVYSEDEKNNIRNYTKYFMPSQTILQSHKDVTALLNNTHDEEYISSKRKGLMNDEELNF